jgi:hypothetical protein
MVGLGSLLLMLFIQVSWAQSSPYTPKKGSPERKAILDAVRKHRKASNELYTPTGFNVLKGWAYVAAPDPNDPGVDTEAFEYILRKSGKSWKVVDEVSHVEGTDYQQELKRIRKRFPTLPGALFPQS